VAATGFIASIVTVHRVLAKTLEIPWAVLNNFTPFFRGDPYVTIPTPISV
jgi:hypothetical protein